MSSLRQQQQPSPPSNPLRDRSIAGDAYTANVPLAFLTVMYARSPLPTCRTPFFAISFPFSPLHVHPTHPLRFTPSLFSSVLVLTSVVSFLRAHSSPFLSFLLLASSPRIHASIVSFRGLSCTGHYFLFLFLLPAPPCSPLSHAVLVRTDFRCRPAGFRCLALLFIRAFVASFSSRLVGLWIEGCRRYEIVKLHCGIFCELCCANIGRRVCDV